MQETTSSLTYHWFYQSEYTLHLVALERRGVLGQWTVTYVDW